MIVKKTSDWSNSDCFVHVKYRQRYIRVRDNFVINVHTAANTEDVTSSVLAASDYIRMACFGMC